MVLDSARLDRFPLRLSALALAAVLLPRPAEAQEAPDLYARVEARIAAQPDAAAKLGRAAPEMAAAADMAGTWNVEAVVTGSGRPAEHGTSVVTELYGGVWLEIRDTYAAGTQDVGYIGFSPMTGLWSSVSIDSLGNANIVTSSGWEGNRIVFEGDLLILGVKAHLRQTIVRLGADEYRLDNEELLATGWKHLDSYRYTRKPKP